MDDSNTDKSTMEAPEENMENTAPQAPMSPLDTLEPNVSGAETAKEAAMSVPMNVQVIIGQAKMPVRSVMNIRRGAVIELDRKAGDTVDIVVNGKVLAKGELTVFEDSRIGVTLVEIARGTP